MRVPSVILFVLAVSVVSSSGCKVRGKNGLLAKRPVSQGLFRSSRDRSLARIGSSLASRGTAECDCYTCRLKQQQTEAYAVESDYDVIESETEVVEQPVSTFDNSFVSPQVLTPDSGPVVQEIEGKLIQDFELTNELPAEPKPDTESTVPSQPEIQPAQPVEVQPLLISPETGMNLNTKEEPKGNVVKSTPTPIVKSTPIKAKTVSARLNKTPTGKQPASNDSIFRFGTRDSSVLEIEKPKRQRDETIWFAPGKEPQPEPAASRPELESIPSTVPREASAPFIEDEIAPIVLTARPVDRHLIYNSRQPTNAPVREARLTTDSHFVPPHQRTQNSQLHFYPLPPQQPSRVPPARVSPAGAPLNPQPLVNPQSSLPLFSPVPKQQEADSAELRLQARVAPADNQRNGSPLLDPPMAQVVRENSPMLILNAAPTSDLPESLPAIVKIRRQNQDRVVVGSLQSTQENTQQNLTSGMNRLHTTPWQPMKTGQDSSAQVHQSIRQLMIQPQQEANYATDGIHR